MNHFRKEVLLTGSSTPEDFILALSDLTAKRFSFRKTERKKPLRGTLSANGGVIRWPINEYRFVSPRSLHFQVHASPEGTVLKGQFVLWLGFRVGILAWLGVGSVVWLEQMIVVGFIHHAGWDIVRQGMLAILTGCCIAYAYTWICILVGRGRDKDMIAVLRNVLTGPEASKVVKDLLIRS